MTCARLRSNISFFSNSDEQAPTNSSLLGAYNKLRSACRVQTEAGIPRHKLAQGLRTLQLHMSEEQVRAVPPLRYVVFECSVP